MTSWEYRIIFTGDAWEIREVYYNNQGKIDSWLEQSTSPTGLTRPELIKDLQQMVNATSLPVLYLVDGKLQEQP